MAPGILLHLTTRFTVICGLAFLPSLSFANEALRDYWTVDQYLTDFPDQQKLSQHFSSIVRQDGIQLDPVFKTKKAKILVVYPGLQASDYWRRSIAAFEARMTELSIDYELTSHFTKAGTEVQKQAKQIRQALKSDTDYFIFTLDALRHKGMIEKVMNQGTTRIFLQNITTPIRAFKSSQPFLYVGFDHSIGTKLLVDRYLQITQGKANYAIFYGTRGYVSAIRGGTFLDAMATHPDMDLKASYYVNFDRKKSYEAAIQVLKDHPDLDFIYSCSTDIALGVIDAVKELDLEDKVTTNGWGGGSAELEAISEGSLEFTVMRINDDNGVAMAEAIRLDLQDQAAQVPTIYSGDFELVDQHTSLEQLQDLKNRAFRYSD